MNQNIPNTQSPDSQFCDDNNEFRQEGRVWKLTFRGEKAYVVDAKGLHYIAWLLRNPGQFVEARRLVEAMEGGMLEGVSGARQENMDFQGVETSKRRLRELEEEIEEAEDNHDLGRLEKLRTEKSCIVAELVSNSGLRGRTRKICVVSERIRKRIFMAIVRSIASIRTEHKALGRHLKNSIRTGASLGYMPEGDVRWIV